MPELPEVEIMTRALASWTQGRALRRVQLLDPRLFASGGGGLASLRLPQAVLGVRRRAKYSLLDLPEHSLVLHFRMTGKLVFHAMAGPVDPSAADVTVDSAPHPAPPRSRLRLWLSGPGAAIIDLVDARCLAQAWVLPRQDVDAWLAGRHLGPEPWPQRQSGDWWQAALHGLRGPIKPALLRQDRVAGLGNICACEALWRAGIDPCTKVPDLVPAQWARLAQAVPDLIDHVLASEGPQLHWVSEGGPNPFLVYGRAGQPCPRCGHQIQRFTQSGRGTWWCAVCQAERHSGWSAVPADKRHRAMRLVSLGPLDRA